MSMVKKWAAHAHPRLEPPTIEEYQGKGDRLTFQFILSDSMNQTLGFFNNSGILKKK